MGILNRLLGTARTATTPASTGRRRPGARRGTTPAAPAARGLGGIAKRLMSGRRGV